RDLQVRSAAREARSVLHRARLDRGSSGPAPALVELQKPPTARGGGYRAAVTLLLMLAYAFNSADRSLIPVIAQPVKADLGLGDTELGLLAGTAFAVLYALAGIPVARLAERRSRVAIISVALAFWSALTALCATAGSFLQLALIRIGIGIGE